jgi:hypothetical protein
MLSGSSKCSSPNTLFGVCEQEDMACVLGQGFEVSPAKSDKLQIVITCPRKSELSGALETLKTKLKHSTVAPDVPGLCLSEHNMATSQAGGTEIAGTRIPGGKWATGSATQKGVCNRCLS